MSYAYTPGLKVKRAVLVRRARALPIPGEVLVDEGDMVSHNTTVARTHVPGDAYAYPVFDFLGIEPEDLKKAMLKKVGDAVKEGELLAVVTSFFGLFKSEYKAPVSGTIELISNVTGMVAIRTEPVPVGIDAYIPGKIVDVTPGIGVVVETPAAFIQGILGIGGERHGKLMVIAGRNEVITPDVIGKECAGKIIVGGSLITSRALKKAEEEGVEGVIVGGVKRKDLTSILGYELGVAITGEEPIEFTLIITEGFGKMGMAEGMFNLLKSLDGRLACINGRTQIRAGVIRPEIIVPIEARDLARIEGETETTASLDGMGLNTRIRIIRQPHFGALGRVISLPAELQEIETRSKVRVAEVELDDGQRVLVPRANVEIIEY